MSTTPPDAAATPPLRTPLYETHVALGARMVPFAGYEMPVQYEDGVLREHAWARTQAGLFDVSHMGQALIVARDGRYETAALALETLVPADVLGLKPGQQRYTQLLNDAGGTIDDLILVRGLDPEAQGRIQIVWNASRKAVDATHVHARLPDGVALQTLDQLALVALQGPAAADVLRHHAPGTDALAFMTAGSFRIGSIECTVTRSGYTGMDGFEISTAGDRVAALWALLTADPRVAPIGLGARDSLRLEAGLCLYGHELDETISPVEAGLAWSIQKVRRAGGARAGGYPGAARIDRELANGVARTRAAFLPEGRAPARDGTEIRAGDGSLLGRLTSGGYGPTLQRPIAMGYVPPGYATTGTEVGLVVRGKALPARVVPLPFVAHTYRRGA